MIDRARLARLFRAMDGMLARHDATPWGAVVGDARLPLIYDANYARVDVPIPAMRLGDVDAALLPVVEATGSRHVHVVTLDPQGSTRLLEEARAAGARMTHDTAMRHEGAEPAPPAHHVEQVTEFDDRFWSEQRRVLPEFGISDAATIDEFLRWQRDVLMPGGKRWFATRIDGATAGFGALFVHENLAYVDDVVTFPEARQRGVASAIVTRMVLEARAAGADHVYLLADEPGPIRLYERLGFRAVGEVVGSLRSRD